MNNKKPIIIDDVNVTKCPHLIEDYQWWDITGQEGHDFNRCSLSFEEYEDFEEEDFCKDNPNCYYKQLKRKEQALQDIKEIAEKVLKKCNNCDQFSCFSCPDENKDELAQQILQKCEVKDE